MTLSDYRIERRFGVYFALISLLWVLLERLIGLHGARIEHHATFSLFFAIPAVSIYVIGMIKKRDEVLNGSMTYGQAVLCGSLITLVVVALSPITYTLIPTVISPDFFDNMIVYVVEAGRMTQEDAQAYFSPGNYRLQGAVGALGLGLLTTLIVGAFVRKKPTS